MLPKAGFQMPEKEDLIAGRQILTRLHEEYFGREADAFELLLRSIKKISEEFGSENESVQIIAASVLDGKIMFAGEGNAEVWVLRNSQLAKLLPSENASSASGFLGNGDVFWLGTKSYFEKITPELMKSNVPINAVLKNPESTDAVITIKVESNLTVAPIKPQGAEVVKPVNFTPSISPMRLKLANFIDKILNILPQKKIFIKEEIGEIENKKRKKMATIVGGILLLLLVISIFFGIRQQKVLSGRSKYEGTLIEAQHNLDEARGLSSINPSRARQLTLEAKSEAEGLVKLGVKDDRLTKLISDITDAMGQIAGLYNVDPSLYLDLTLQSGGFHGDDIAASDERMAVLDKSKKLLYSIDIDTKKTTTAAGPDTMPNSILVAAYSDRNFVSANDGIWSVGDKAENIIKPEWGGSILISAYTGNFYVLDKNNSAVWRYQGNGGQFDPKQNWFGTGIKPDLSNVIAWTIDGNIWMLTSDGQVLRFSGGSPINFSLIDLDKDLQANDIFTTQ